jgi:hypothetical protein
MTIEHAHAHSFPTPWGVADALSGGARVGSFDVGIGDGIFAQSDRVESHAGADGMVCLAAYTACRAISHLLQDLREPGALDLVATSFPQAKAGPANGRPEIGQ